MDKRRGRNWVALLLIIGNTRAAKRKGALGYLYFIDVCSWQALRYIYDYLYHCTNWTLWSCELLHFCLSATFHFLSLGLTDQMFFIFLKQNWPSHIETHVSLKAIRERWYSKFSAFINDPPNASALYFNKPETKPTLMDSWMNSWKPFNRGGLSSTSLGPLWKRLWLMWHYM